MFINVTVRLVVTADEGVSATEVINEMDYDFVSQTDGATIDDSSIQDFEVTDSK